MAAPLHLATAFLSRTVDCLNPSFYCYRKILSSRVGVGILCLAPVLLGQLRHAVVDVGDDFRRGDFAVGRVAAVCVPAQCLQQRVGEDTVAELAEFGRHLILSRRSQHDDTRAACQLQHGFLLGSHSPLCKDYSAMTD